MMAKHAHILLADDDVEDQDILKSIFTEKDLNVSIHCVFNGKQAIAYLEGCSPRELPSLIILDYKMPVMNAVETLERLKDNARLKGIPKVVWSTSEQNEHRKLSMENGAIQYFAKPNNQAELSDLPKQMLLILNNQN
ncbi:MAG TPA: response regulator [Puia sp.]